MQPPFRITNAFERNSMKTQRYVKTIPPRYRASRPSILAAILTLGLAGMGLDAHADFAFTTPRIQGAPGATITFKVTETLDGGPTDGGDNLRLYVDKTFIGTAMTDGSGQASFTYIIPTTQTQGIHAYSILSSQDCGAGKWSGAGRQQSGRH